MITSRIVNVIETKDGEQTAFFTLEGVMIGAFKGGTRIEPLEPEEKVEKPLGQVVKPPSPKEVKRQQEQQVENDISAESRLVHLKKDVA